MWSVLATLYLPLVIYEEESEETAYTVVTGDTSWRIARCFNTTIDAINQSNNLKSNILGIG